MIADLLIGSRFDLPIADWFMYVCKCNRFLVAAEAVLSEGNVEPYLPNAWTEEEASVLAHLVGLYGPTNWGIIAAGVATKSETQVRK